MDEPIWPLGIEPGQEVEVDVFRPEDASGVAALFRQVYGDGYPVQTYYDPGLLVGENAGGNLISVVSRTARGEVVGHIALFGSSPNRRLFELGAGAVLSSYRNTARLLTRMMAEGPGLARERFGLEAVFGDPVCVHVYSQKICHGLGWVTHALEVDLMPARLYDKAAPRDGRVSAAMDFLTLAPHPHRVHIPAAYERSFRFFYQALDDTRQIGISDETPPAGERTRLETKVFPFSQLARLALWEIGTDFGETLDREEEYLRQEGVRVFQIWLRLSCPWVGWAVDRLRERGWFLGGLLPRWFGEDGMLMQRLAGPPHWDGIQLLHDRARAVLSLVREDWEKVRDSRRTA